VDSQNEIITTEAICTAMFRAVSQSNASRQIADVQQLVCALWPGTCMACVKTNFWPSMRVVDALQYLCLVHRGLGLTQYAMKL